jgi:hypothetical protein
MHSVNVQVTKTIEHERFRGGNAGGSVCEAKAPFIVLV